MTSKLNRRDFPTATAAGATLATLPGLLQMAHGEGIQTDGTLRLALDITPSVLNPMLSRLNPEYLPGELLHSGLTTLAADMSAQPDLATDWSANANANATGWLFSLREMPSSRTERR
ncbi:hypothetical protein [Puniceibacterium confluentis]|uniref:hypothetical protein n=1 Tax=Puniceibacterium confluentis TaxID=1958944 RepID=UPI0035672980